MDWNDIRWFYEVSKHGSFSAAARANKTTQATISRRIQGLENELGAALFQRGREGSELTDIGKQLEGTAQKMHSAAEAFLNSFNELSQGSQKLTITCGSLIGLFLTKNLGLLNQDLPSVEIEIKTTNQFLDLEKGEADLALRNKRPEKGMLKSKKLKSQNYGAFSVYGSSQHFSNNQCSSIEELKNHPWISYARSLKSVPTGRWIEENIGEENIKFRMNTASMILEAVGQNQALALLPQFLGSITPGIVEVFGPVPEFNFEMWMVKRESSQKDPHLNTLIANIEKIFE